ncbi:MAG TPA: SHOCT domain-containing protein [Phycicoccus sp.]|nr:SHOCT domain-containing protein [Phycicoccus sp.]
MTGGASGARARRGRGLLSGPPLTPEKSAEKQCGGWLFTVDREGRLCELESLRDRGVISEEEFRRQRAAWFEG